MGDELEVTITYESLFDILRKEKNNDELQKLPATFYSDVTNYMNEKKRAFAKESADLFSDQEIENLQIQLNNVRRIIRELFERRERKIINLAVNKIRAPGSVVDKSTFLQPEQKFFEYQMDLLTRFRSDVLDRVMSVRPRINPEPMPETATRSMTEPPAEPEPVTAEAKEPKDTVTVRFVQPVPKFLGQQKESYGPFEPEDIASIPAKIGDLLIRKGRAEEIDIQ